MTAAPMESCRFAARRSPGVRFGSAVVACKRLHRTRRRLQHILANSLSRQKLGGCTFSAKFFSLLESGGLFSAVRSKTLKKKTKEL